MRRYDVSRMHRLHHAHFDCNYGATHIPIDNWMGTFIASKADLKKIWGRTKAGADANETAVHEGAAAAAEKPTHRYSLRERTPKKARE